MCTPRAHEGNLQDKADAEEVVLEGFELGWQGDIFDVSNVVLKDLEGFAVRDCVRDWLRSVLLLLGC